MGCYVTKQTDFDTKSAIPNGKKSWNETEVKRPTIEKWKSDRSELDLLQPPNNEEIPVKKSSPVEVKRFKVGDKVHLRGYVGTVKFIGATELGQGDWIGIEMDKELSQGHNGSYEGIQYFFCQPKHGVFARSSLVHLLDKSDQETIEKPLLISPHTVVFIQTRIRRYIKKIRKKRLELHSDMDRDIDKHVRATPDSETESIQKLSEYLTEPWDDCQRSRIFAIYRWITLNVVFDSDGYFGREGKQSCDAESVLRNRTAVSEGYANLLKALCTSVNIQARAVNGYAKGYGYKPGGTFLEGQTTHTWNVVRLRIGWFICDATWGSGYCGEDMMFNREPNVDYFMMDPELAVTDHFPLDPMWQLTDSKMTKEVFERLVVPSSVLFNRGVRLLSHKEYHHSVDSDHITMSFLSPRPNIIKGVLKDSMGEIIGPRNMVQTVADEECNEENMFMVSMTAYFPEPGEYKLQVCLLNPEGLQWVTGVEYGIRASEGVGQNAGGFPHIGTHFHSLGFELDTPQENIQTDNGTVCISLRCSNLKVTNLKCKLSKLYLTSGDSELRDEVQDKSMCYTEPDGPLFKLKVHLPQTGTYKLDIFAKKQKGDSEYICTYFVNSWRGVRPPPGFPHISDKFRAFGFQLVDRFENIEARDGSTSVTLRVPKGITINGYLTCGEDDLPNMCYTDEGKPSKMATTLDSTVHIHTPRAGIFKVNIFGRKGPDGPSHFLCSYVVRSLRPAGDNPGFPRISELFKSWGLEVVNQQRNITTPDGKASVVIKAPQDVRIDVQLNEVAAKEFPGMCLVKSDDEEERQILIHTPTQGFFTLNIFGRRGKDKKFLCSYRIKSLRAASENPGFPQLTEKFREWGIQMVDTCENILTNTGRGSVRLKVPGGILLQGRLQHNEQQQTDLNLCFTERNGDTSLISFHIPEAGVYRLDVFGREGPGSQPHYLGCYSVLSTRGLGERAGFPQVSDDFRSWGLRLESHKENIAVYDGSVVLTFLNPNKIELEVRLLNAGEEDMTKASVKRDWTDDRMAFHCKLPTKGKYTFTVSGSNVPGSKKRQLLCSYKIFY